MQAVPGMEVWTARAVESLVQMAGVAGYAAAPSPGNGLSSWDLPRIWLSRIPVSDPVVT